MYNSSDIHHYLPRTSSIIERSTIVQMQSRLERSNVYGKRSLLPHQISRRPIPQCLPTIMPQLLYVLFSIMISQTSILVGLTRAQRCASIQLLLVTGDHMRVLTDQDHSTSQSYFSHFVTIHLHYR